MEFNPTKYIVSESDRDVVLTLLASAPAAVDYIVEVNTFNGTAGGELCLMKHLHSVFHTQIHGLGTVFS